MLHLHLPYQDLSPSSGVMIRPYLNGFTIAFNVSQPSTWQPYVDNMHHFLAGESLSPWEPWGGCFYPWIHACSAGVSSWAAQEPHLEREAHKVMGALPFQV